MDYHDSQAPMRVKDIMSTNIISVSENDSIMFVIKMFDRAKVSGAPVINEDGECQSLITKSDLFDETFITQIMAHSHPSQLLVKDFVKPGHLVTISEEMSVEDAAVMMVERRVHRLLVHNDSGQMSGLISTFDIAKYVAGRAGDHPAHHHRSSHSLDKKAKILRLQEELHRRP